MYALFGGDLPNLDGPVRRAGDEMLVVGGEGNAQDPARMTRKRRDEAPVRSIVNEIRNFETRKKLL